MKAIGWKTYRTRFLVNAKQLSSSLSFIDHLGRQHCGRKGDYLVESSDGVLSIAPRQIFEDIYVAMSRRNPATPSDAAEESRHLDPQLSCLPVEPLKIESIKQQRFPYPDDSRPVHPHGSPRLRPKAPQPVHPLASRFGLM